MISKQFKKSLIKQLKDDYNINCHSLSIKNQVDKNYQDYSLSCINNHESFTLTLRVNICDVDTSSHLHSFYVFLKSASIDCISNLKNKITYDLLTEAIIEVREVFSYISPSFGFLFVNKTVTLITGIYFVGSSYFEIKSIKSFVNTTNVLNIYDCIGSEQNCSNINITGNDICVEPYNSYSDNTAFKDCSNLLYGDLTTFKTNFAKSVILFLNEKYRNKHNDAESDYMSLNYENLKRYLLVHKMSTI